MKAASRGSPLIGAELWKPPAGSGC
jgi:hypothetical protein